MLVVNRGTGPRREDAVIEAWRLEQRDIVEHRVEVSVIIIFNNLKIQSIGNKKFAWDKLIT